MNKNFSFTNSALGACTAAMFASVVISAPANSASHTKEKGDSRSMQSGSMDHPAGAKDARPAKQMDGMSMTGDADYDFAVNMRMHHQMAVDMSAAELKEGKSPQMLRMAKSISAAQKKEIAAFDQWIARHPKQVTAGAPKSK